MEAFNDPSGDPSRFDVFRRANLADPSFWKRLHETALKARYARKPPPIRGRIFTSELKTLADQIREHSPQTAGRSEISGPESGEGALHFEDVLPEHPGVFHLMMRLHADRGVSLPSSALLEDVLDRCGAQSAALLLFSREEAVFATVLSTGLDSGTSRNLWIPIHDPFLDQASLHTIEVNELLKENPFFKKRFSREFLARLGTILVCRRTDPLYPSLLLLFYHRGERPGSEVFRQHLEQFMDWVHPLLVRQSAHGNENPGRNIYARVSSEVRAFLSLGRGGMLLQFHFDHLLERETCRRFIREIRQALSFGRNCLALRIRHNELKLLLPASEAERDTIVRAIENLAAGFNVGVRWDEQVVGPGFVSSMVL